MTNVTFNFENITYSAFLIRTKIGVEYHLIRSKAPLKIGPILMVTFDNRLLVDNKEVENEALIDALNSHKPMF